MTIQWQRTLGGLLGATSIAAGAFGAHGFKTSNAIYIKIFDTGARYHLVHSALLLMVPSICGGAKTRAAKISGFFLACGILLFSGSCYTVAMLEDRKYSKAAPFGGLSLMAGWISLALIQK